MINLEIEMSPVLSEAGDVVGVSTFARDITKRKRIESDLAFLAEVSKDLVDLTNTRDTMSTLGEKIGKYFNLSHCHFVEVDDLQETCTVIYGWQRTGVLNVSGPQHFRDLLPPDLVKRSRSGETAVVSNVSANPEIGSFIIVPIVHNGVWLFWMGFYDSQVRAWRKDEIELMRELTTRIWIRLERAQADQAIREFNAKLEKEVEERTAQLKQTINQLDSFNYIASHDLQEPLRKIRTYVELLNELKLNDEKLNKYHRKIYDSSERMAQLIQSLLSYSRSTRSTEIFQPVDLNQTFREVCTDYEIAIKEREAVIESSTFPLINAVPFQMYQLFSNLISNALKFSDEKPEIRIISRILNGSDIPDEVPSNFHDQQFVEIAFSDNGIGFENRHRDKIFKLFQRLHADNAYRGTGIGLSIVSKIVLQHKGYIRAEGRPNEGATFWIYLPL